MIRPENGPAKVRPRAALTVAVMLLASALPATALTAPATAASGTTSGTGGPSIVTVASTTPLPDTVPADVLGAGDTGTVTPTAATPDGFKLTDPGYRRSDYVYDSDPVYLETFKCVNGTCYVQAAVKAQLHEEAIGGSSHAWKLTMNLTQYSNPGNLTWSLASTYWCGVNVKGGDDYTCNNGAAPSDAPMSVNTEVKKPWGATNGITVFPMVRPSVLFSNGGSANYKFRGFDTYSRASTTKLVPDGQSGTGA